MSTAEKPILPKWTKGQLLGFGSYGRVYLAVLKEFNNLSKYFAIKESRIEKSSSLQKEWRIYNNLKNCPEIINCFGAQLTNDQEGAEFYNLFLEYAPAGTLLDLIHKSTSGVISETNIRIYTRMILKGLSHMHSKGYVHCDLKPDNILAFPSDENNTSYQLKIADFGLAKEPGEELPIYNDKSTYFRGTEIYMSPESVARAEIKAPLDIWSLGCIVIQMFTGNLPWKLRFDYKDLDDLFYLLAIEVKNPEIPKDMSEDGKDFLSKCFIKMPQERWSAQMLLNHPYVSESSKYYERHMNSIPLPPPGFTHITHPPPSQTLPNLVEHYCM